MRKSALLVLFLTVFIDLLGFGIVIPLLPYYAREYGATGRMVGVVVAVYSLMQFFFSPIWGRLSDRIGRRPVLLISLAGGAIGYLMFASARTLLMLFVARMIAGIAAANIGTAQAYIADSTTPENRSRGMGMIGAAFGLGFILGPPIGGLLSSAGTHFGWSGNLLPGLVSAALSLTAATVAWFALPESRTASTVVRSRKPPQFDFSIWRHVAGNKPLVFVLATLTLIIVAFAAMETTVTLHGRDRFGFTPRDLGLFFGFMGVIVAVIQGGLIGRLSQKWGEKRITSVGALSLAVGMLGIPLVFKPSLLFAVAFFVAVGQALSYPSLHSLLTKVSSADEHGTILGISASLGSLGRIVGPIVGGFLYDGGGAQAAFFTAAAILFVAFGLSFRIPAKPRADVVS